MRLPNVGPDIEQGREKTHLATQDTMNKKQLQVKRAKQKKIQIDPGLSPCMHVRSNPTAMTTFFAGNMPASLQ